MHEDTKSLMHKSPRGLKVLAKGFMGKVMIREANHHFAKCHACTKVGDFLEEGDDEEEEGSHGEGAHTLPKVLEESL